jgi:hypothetical protein
MEVKELKKKIAELEKRISLATKKDKWEIAARIIFLFKRLTLSRLRRRAI